MIKKKTKKRIKKGIGTTIFTFISLLLGSYLTAVVMYISNYYDLLFLLGFSFLFASAIYNKYSEVFLKKWMKKR